MTVIFASVLVSMALAGCTAYWSRRSGRVLRLRYQRLVIVTTKSGSAFRGALFDSDPESLVLRNAQALGAGPAPDVGVDGELILFRADIAMIQRP